MNPKILVVIPARYSSSRLPGKPLLELDGKTIIQRVYEQAQNASLPDHVVVATDDSRIYDHIRSFGGDAVMTSDQHVSGTDRCAEATNTFQNHDFIINVQGDEPFIQPEQVDKLATLLVQGNSHIATLAIPITRQDDIHNHNIVKVVLSEAGQAMYFSRSAIPFVRDVPVSEWLNAQSFYRHIGMYAFRKKVLMEVKDIPVHSLENAEKLEQLRWLANGYKIAVGISDYQSIGIDTAEDLKLAESYIKLRENND